MKDFKGADVDDLKKRKSKSRPYIGYEVPELEEPDEKPWHRVNASSSTVPSPFLLLVLGFYLLLAFLTQLVEDDMPSVLRDADIAGDNTNAFSEESALRYLNTIMGTKPRVSGSEYHLRQTEVLKDLLDDIARGSRLPVRTDWQLASGDYRLEFGAPLLNSYNNVSNIIALLEGESGVLPNGELGSSILLNCHYDSVPFALGASDNVAFCAIMTETLHRMSQKREKFKHNLIFLFNGAEENPLQGSHAFLQHPWSRGVTTVVNLDAAGMNGKANLFQVSDTRLLGAYAGSTNRPSAQSMGEFLFTSGIVPSDTDFRIWRDFGQIYGVDIAFVKWGNVYHTRNDHPDNLQPGVLQCAGDMFLTLVTRLADMPELAQKATPSSAVYYDFLNTVLVRYPVWASYLVDALIALAALASVGFYVWIVGMRWSTVQGLLVSALGRLLATGASFVVGLLLIFLMIATTTQLRYLARQWMVVPIFWMPYVISVFLVSQAYDAWTCKKSGLNRSFRALQASAATRLLLSLVLLVMTCIPVLSTVRYILSVPLFMMSVTSVIPLLLVRYLRVPAWQQLAAELCVSVPQVMWVSSLCLRVDALMLPVMGRSSNDSPDVIVGLLNLGLAVLLTSLVSGIELLFSRRRLWLPAAMVAVTVLVLMFIPFSPYGHGSSLQRHYWFHSEIITYTDDPPTRTSGVLVSKQDRYSTRAVLAALRDSRLNYTARTDFTEDCQKYVYCNLPLYRTRFTEFFSQGVFINMPPPTPFATPPSLRLTSKVCVGTNCTLNFAMDGPAHNTLTIWPRSGDQLLAWSLDSPIIESFTLNGRPVYSVLEATATYQEVFGTIQFWLTFHVPTSQQSGPIVDISHHANKKQHPEDFSPEYQQLLDAMPEYFNIDSSITIRSNYAF
ncbi:endoplasmic reticulum metallopeptidase 1-like [Choristoneura fumiferana]|uniref:endoplasmic reticulum metallopeptidase 1-like n=1 Tax=Choristoneura fumiferana TaxID=7141 RepID=UPI003D15B526